jgi:tetratricopeptide (TPR) repeat protein
MRIFLFFIPAFFFVNTMFAQIPATDSLNTSRNSTADSSLSEAAKYLSASKISKAFIELRKARELYLKTGNKKGQLEVNIAFAEYYDKNQLWNNAERYYKESLLLSTAVDSTEIPAAIAFRLAEILYKQNNYERALHYSRHALGRYQDLGLKARMAECYVLMARLSKEQKNYRQAETYILKQALPLFRSAGNEYGRISCFDALGNIYHEQKRYSEAKWFFIQANTQSRNLKDTTEIINSLVKLGKVKIDIRDYDLALRDFKEAELLSRKKRLLVQMTDVKKAYSLLYKKTGDKRAASGYMGAYSVLNDSIASVQNSRVVAAKKAEEDADKFIKLSHAEKKKVVKVQDKNWYLYFLSGFIILTVVSVIAYRIRKRRFKRF